MGQAADRSLPTSFSGTPLMVLFLGTSLAIHAVVLGLASSRYRPGDASRPSRATELVMVEVEKPKPPLAPAEEVKPEPVKVPPRVVRAKLPNAQKNLPLKAEESPPPPNDAPPPEPEKTAPIVTGISMSSTTVGGAFAAPVGNTLYGKTPEKAASSADVKPYAAPKFVPSSSVDSGPVVLVEPKPDYQRDAHQAWSEHIEGTVRLSIVVDAEGKVVSARVLRGPGSGLNEAALKAIWKARFRPALKSGQPVSTEIQYDVTFVLND